MTYLMVSHWFLLLLLVSVHVEIEVEEELLAQEWTSNMPSSAEVAFTSKVGHSENFFIY